MAEVQQYKCPSCGGAVEFDASSQMIKCPWCDTEFDVSVFDNEETIPDKMDWNSPTGGEWTQSDVISAYVCQSCGGEIFSDENTAATRCPWCDNPVVMTDRISGMLKPDYLIPFKFTKKDAKEALRKHCKKKLVPKVFSSENKIEEIRGVYVPFWIFNTDTKSKARYKATKVRTWSDSRYNYTETSYFSVMRGGTLRFSRIPVDGSSKLENEITEAIEPFDFTEAIDFQTAYLAGYLADKYDVSNEECIPRVNERVKKSVEAALRSTIHGYTSVVNESIGVQLNNTDIKYALYPVWILKTVWKDKNYTFAMNGQTGKFVGDLPVDRKQWWSWLFAISVPASIIAFVISLLIEYVR